MITLPNRVSDRSQEMDVVCDWIEGSVIFDEQSERLSKIDVIDVLIDADIFSSQDKAHAYVSSAWEAVKTRQSVLGNNTPFMVSDGWLERTHEWQIFPAYSFCLLLSISTWTGIKQRWQGLGGGYTLEGELFELLTATALERHFPSWDFHVVGWSRFNTGNLPTLVKELGSKIRERDLDVYTDYLDPARAKDVGLDLIGYRTFRDTRGALPIFFLQCATGNNWNEKLHTPDMELWGKMIDFTSKPKRGFSMPFSLLEEERKRDFKNSALKVGGPFFDRYRLLSVSPNDSSPEEWVVADLKNRLIGWITPRIDFLQWDS